jgi:VanZ family protein
LAVPEEGKHAVTKLVTLARRGAWLAGLVVIALSVLPGKMRPHILGNDYYEHFIAYFTVGSLLAIGYLRPVQLLSSGVLLALCAGLLEFVQLWIPGRTASVDGFATSTIGTWTGLLVVVVVRRAYLMKSSVKNSQAIDLESGNSGLRSSNLPETGDAERDSLQI